MRGIYFFIILFFASLAFAREYLPLPFKQLKEVVSYSREFSENENYAINTYITKEDTFYQDINGFLRSNQNPNFSWVSVSPHDAKNMINDLDRSISLSSLLPSNLILFRGVDLNYRQNRLFKVGEVIVEKAYLSTSTDVTIAKKFAQSSQGAIMLFYAENSMGHALLIDQEGESEVLLAHGHKIKIMAVDNSSNPQVVVAVVCAQESCEEKMNSHVRELMKFTK